ncbi:MAG: ABC transporter substrate-binding protein [Bacteroidota bacterium]
MKKVIALVSLVAFIFIAGCKKEDEQNFATVNVGAMLSLTGNWSTLGIPSKAAIEIAVEEINADFEARNVPFRFSSSVYDTKLDTALAKTYMSNALNSGVRLIIGPQSSAEVGAIKSIADGGKMLVVSQGSTASTLAIANDAIYRYCPGDAIEGAAIASSIYDEGKKGLIVVARDDAGNIGLQNSVKNAFAAKAGTTVEYLTPYATTTTDYSTLLNDIKARIATLSATYGNSAVGVYLASFDEAVDIFNQANGDTVLQSVNWYGGDGFIKSNVILSSSAACDFAIATSYYAPEFGLPMSAQPKWQPLTAAILSRCGQQPDAYAIAAYDAMWVLARTVEANNGIPADAANLRNSFVAQTAQFSGATGSITLNTYGDRANGSFDYWGLQKVNGVYSWKFVKKSL